MPQLMTSIMFGCAVLLAGPAQAQAPAAAPLQHSEPTGNKLKSGANSFAEGQARQLLKDKGYADISPLINDSDGIWHGTATKDQKQVDVSIDYQGRIDAK